MSVSAMVTIKLPFAVIRLGPTAHRSLDHNEAVSDRQNLLLPA